MLTYSFAAQVDMGLRRANNEDNVYVCGSFLSQEMRDRPFAVKNAGGTPCVFAVCDGMGGEQEGEFASFSAASMLSGFENRLLSSPPSKLGAEVDVYIDAVNTTICERMSAINNRIGTTLGLLILREDGAYAFNVGDSRIYHFREGILNQISVDHTSDEPWRKDNLSADATPLLHRKRSNILTQCIGVSPEEFVIVPYAAAPITVKKGDVFLLCSDGLTDMVDNRRLQSIVALPDDLENVAKLLVTEALNGGGKDNISVVMLRIESAGKKFGFHFFKR